METTDNERCGSDGTHVSCSSCETIKSKLNKLQSENDRLTSLFNEAKKELQREKSIATQLTENNAKVCSAMESLQFRNESLVARVHVLEELLPASGRRKVSNGKQGKTPSFTQMRKGELKAYVRNLPEKYHALCLQVRSFSDGTVFDETTESRLVCDGVQADPLRVRDWAGKYEELSQPTDDEYIGRGPIVTKTGTAVPISPIKLMSNGFFTPRGPHPDYIIKAALWNVVSEDEDFKKFKEDDPWDTALHSLQRDEATRSYIMRVVTTSLSNQNREAKVHFFVSLGYGIFDSRIKLSDQCREQEKKDIRSFFCTDTDGAVVTLDNINTTLWRTSFWCDAYNPTKECPEEQPVEEIPSEGTDTLFRNSAARSAFITFLKYAPGEDESVMSLARADAWFTACIFLVSLPDGKGGKRNCQFKEAFSYLLPRCLSTILGNFHRYVLEESPQELCMSPLTFLPTLKHPTEIHFRLQIGNRGLTDVIFMPSDRAYYVFIKKKPFKEHICHWLYFLDAFIAKSDEAISSFQALGDCGMRTDFCTAKRTNKDVHAAVRKRFRLFNDGSVDPENEHSK